MENHAEREKIHPRCKWAHVCAPEVPIKVLWVKKMFKYNWASCPRTLLAAFFDIFSLRPIRKTLANVCANCTGRDRTMTAAAEVCFFVCWCK